MKYFLDTEFHEEPGTLTLISIALVAEDGREYYAVSSDFDSTICGEWVRAHVLPKLPSGKYRKPRQQIAQEVLEFVDEKPEFWGYFADYDWVVLCWLFGAMIDLPKGWPMFCMDLKQVMVERGISKKDLPKLPEDQAHDALVDARWMKDVWSYIFDWNKYVT